MCAVQFFFPPPRKINKELTPLFNYQQKPCNVKTGFKWIIQGHVSGQIDALIAAIDSTKKRYEAVIPKYNRFTLSGA